MAVLLTCTIKIHSRLAYDLLQEKREEGENKMLKAALIFFVLALVAMLFGAKGIAGLNLNISQTYVWVFLVLAVVSGLIGLFSGRPPKKTL
jgi:uncharacterized membrane protein YtjA (UPF0391 family)